MRTDVTDRLVVIATLGGNRRIDPLDGFALEAAKGQETGLMAVWMLLEGAAILITAGLSATLDALSGRPGARLALDISLFVLFVTVSGALLHFVRRELLLVAIVLSRRKNVWYEPGPVFRAFTTSRDRDLLFQMACGIVASVIGFTINRP